MDPRRLSRPLSGGIPPPPPRASYWRSTMSHLKRFPPRMGHTGIFITSRDRCPFQVFLADAPPPDGLPAAPPPLSAPLRMHETDFFVGLALTVGLMEVWLRHTSPSGKVLRAQQEPELSIKAS